MLSRIRSAITGRFVATHEADLTPDTTVRETWSTDPDVELRVAAEAVVLGAAYEQKGGRVEINQRDLDRLREALGDEPLQP